MNERTTTRAKWVRCPGCGQQALYSLQNAARPFCSARCRSADLGAWASEEYRVASQPPAAGDEPELSAGHQPH